MTKSDPLLPEDVPVDPSWTKGGRARIVPRRNAEQREVLRRAHLLAGAYPDCSRSMLR